MHSDTLAIDFGTSNSAAATLVDGQIHRIAIEEDAETLPTAVFFPAGRGGVMRIGTAAAQALIDGEEGRYMRALKSVLGTQLLHEKRHIGGRDRTLSGIITQFLIEVRERAEKASGRTFGQALSGRPVHFHSASQEKDEQAEKDLRACYLAAGFDDVTFLAEPEAAALASHTMKSSAAKSASTSNQTGLIVDIGGGTSDFSVFRSDGRDLEILANHGIRLGGTDFDYAVSMGHVMPLLGLGGELRRAMGKGLIPVPRAPFIDLATWAKIPFLYTTKTRDIVSDMVRMAVDRDKMNRFATILEMELGHELAFAIERSKIAVNQSGQAIEIDMAFIEQGLSQTITPQSLNKMLTGNQSELGKAAALSLEMASVAPGDIGRVILVGGSSLMSFVSDEMKTLCPGADILRSQAFTAVVDGLALATRG